MSPEPYAWNVHTPGILAAGAIAGVYAVALRGEPVPRWRLASFAGSLALLVVTEVSPLATLSQHYLLSAHFLQNVALAEWAPALLVLGVPPGLARRLGSLPGARVLTHPAVALSLWLATYAAWHLPAVYDAALERPRTLLHLEHLTYVAAGVLFWWPVFQSSPRALASGAKAVYLFAAFLLASPLGILVFLLSHPVYDFYVRAPDLWGLSDLADQQIAGVTMSAEESVVFFSLCAYYLVRFVREEEAREALRASVRPTSGSR